MWTHRRQNRILGIRLPVCALASLTLAHAAHAVPVSLFTECGHAVPLVMHEALQEIERVVEKLSATRSDRRPDAIGYKAREILACELERGGGILDLFLGGLEEAARAKLDMEQVWGTTLAVNERALLDERTHGHSTEPSLSGSLAGADR